MTEKNTSRIKERIANRQEESTDRVTRIRERALQKLESLREQLERGLANPCEFTTIANSLHEMAAGLEAERALQEQLASIAGWIE